MYSTSSSEIESNNDVGDITGCAVVDVETGENIGGWMAGGDNGSGEAGGNTNILPPLVFDTGCAVVDVENGEKLGGWMAGGDTNCIAFVDLDTGCAVASVSGNGRENGCIFAEVDIPGSVCDSKCFDVDADTPCEVVDKPPSGAREACEEVVVDVVDAVLDAGLRCPSLEGSTELVLEDVCESNR